jgi:appr-1-p processing enzyme family protein
MISYKLFAKQGDLLTAKADFAVNPSNTAMLLGSGVSMAFKRKCGILLEKYMQDALKRCGAISQGDVIKTASNYDNFPHVLHAAVMNYTEKNKPKVPTIQTIKEILQNLQQILLLEQEDNLTLAIPLIGCGIGGLEKSEVILEYKNFFLYQEKADKKCDVMVYGYNQSDFELIEKI